MNRIFFPQVQLILRLTQEEVQDKKTSLSLSPNNYLLKGLLSFDSTLLKRKPSAPVEKY